MCVYSLNVHRTRRVCVRRGGASRRSARRSEKATSTSRFRAWNCLASIYRGTEREGTVGPEGVAAADGKGWLWSMVCTDDGRFVVDHVIRILSSRTYTPSLIGPITQPFPLFFFFFSTFVTNVLFPSFSILLSFFWSFHNWFVLAFWICSYESLGEFQIFFSSAVFILYYSSFDCSLRRRSEFSSIGRAFGFWERRASLFLF